MAAPAGVDLGLRGARAAAIRDPGRRGDDPAPPAGSSRTRPGPCRIAASPSRLDRSPTRRAPSPVRGRPRRRRRSPTTSSRNVLGAASIALLQVRRVALRAHEVPVLDRPGPVQRVVGRHALVRIEVEPALPAVRLRARVPGDARAPGSGRRELDQVLLQRIDAEDVGDRGSRASWPSGPSVRTKILAVAPEKVVVTPKCLKCALSKLPSTVPASAGCIARSWCEPLHSLSSAAWQPTQTAPPTKVAAAERGRGVATGRAVEGAACSRQAVDAEPSVAARSPARRGRRFGTPRIIRESRRPVGAPGSLRGGQERDEREFSLRMAAASRTGCRHPGPAS